MRMFSMACVIALSLMTDGSNGFAEDRWEMFGNTNGTKCTASSGSILWCGTACGLIRYDTESGSRRVFTTLDGLPDNYILHIAIDRDGIVWVGTLDGLASFDGSVWNVFSAETGLPGSLITAIAVDHDNVTWVGLGGKGLISYDGDAWREHPLGELMSHVQVDAITIDHQNAVWVAGADALLKYDGTQWLSWYRKGICDVEVAPDDMVWTLEDDGMFVFDGSAFTKKFDERDFDDVALYTDFTLDDNGMVWLSCYGANGAIPGLLHYDPADNISTILSTAEGFSAMRPQALSFDSTGSLWICSDDGLTRYDGVSFTHVPTGSDDPATNNLRGLCVCNGVLWGCGFNAVSMFDGVSWSQYSSDSYGFGPNVYDIAPAYDGSMWFAGNSRLTCYKDGVWTNFDPPDIMTTMLCTAVDHDGIVWVGTGNGAFSFDGATFERVLDDYINDSIADSSGRIWFGGTKGLWCIDGENRTLYNTLPFGANTEVRVIAEAPDKAIWIGGRSGIARFDGSSWQSWSSADCKVGAMLSALTFDKNGNLWAGSDTGAVMFDGSVWKTYTKKDGLSDNTVLSIATQENMVWFGTSRGGLSLLIRNTEAKLEAVEPVVFSLAQNTPNPFNPSTTIRFSLAGETRVTLDIFAVNGAKVATLAEVTMSAGEHEVVWDASGFPSGIYFCRLKAGGNEKTIKMTLVK